MGDVKVSAAGTSELIVAYSNFRKNSGTICENLITLTNKLMGEDGGNLQGADGEEAAKVIAKFQKAVEKLMVDATEVNKTLDDKLEQIFGLDKGAMATIAEKSDKEIAKMGNIAKKH